MAEIIQTFYDNMGESITVGGAERIGIDDKKACLEFSTTGMTLGYHELEMLQSFLDWVKNDYLEACN